MHKPTESSDTFEIPEEYCCPITSLLMLDPVSAPDGYTYEREAIERWLAKEATSPMTRKPMNAASLHPNLFAKQAIMRFLENNITKLSANNTYLPRTWQQGVMDAIFAIDIQAFKRAIDKDPLRRLLTCKLHGYDSNSEEIPDELQRTALQLACEVSNSDFIKSITELMGDKLESAITQPQPSDFNPVKSEALLLESATKGDIDSLRLALKLWANIDTVDSKNKNALHNACEGGYDEMVDFLLEQSILLIHQKDEEGHTPRYYAVVGGHLSLVKKILKYDRVNDVTCLEHAATILQICRRRKNENRIPILHALLKQTPHLANATCSVGQTVINEAALVGDLEIIKVLLAYKADPTIKWQGKNALHLAITGEKLDIVKYLIESAKMDIRTKTDQGDSPLELAKLCENPAIEKYLCKFLNPWENDILSLRNNLRLLQSNLTEQQSNFRAEISTLVKTSLELVDSHSQTIEKILEEQQKILEEQQKLRRENTELLQYIKQQSKIASRKLALEKNRNSDALKLIQINASAIQKSDNFTEILRSDFFKNKLAKWEAKYKAAMQAKQDELVKACKLGDIITVKELLESGADAMTPDYTGTIPIIAAAANLQEQVIYYLESVITKNDETELPSALLKECHEAVQKAQSCPFEFNENMKLSQFCKWVHENRYTFMLFVKSVKPEWRFYSFWDKFCEGKIGIILNIQTQLPRVNTNPTSEWRSLDIANNNIDVAIKTKEYVYIKQDYVFKTIARWSSKNKNKQQFDSGFHNRNTQYNRAVDSIVYCSKGFKAWEPKQRLLNYFAKKIENCVELFELNTPGQS